MAKRKGLLWTVSFQFGGASWFDPIAGELSRLIQALPVWGELATIEARGLAKTALTPAVLDKALRSDARGGSLRSAPDEELVQVSWQRGASLTVQVVVHDAAWTRHARALAPLLTTWTAAFGKAIALPESGISPAFDPDLPWKEVPDRPSEPYLRYEHVIAVVDARVVKAWDDEERAAILGRLIESEPADARVDKHGQITLLHFTDDLLDERALTEGRQRHERWLVGVVDPKRAAAGGSASAARKRSARAAPAKAVGDGDEQVVVHDQRPAKGLSFVDAKTRVGFKTVVVFPDGSVETAAWDQARKIAAAGAVPGGPVLDGVYLVVPLREHAVALAGKAKKAGFKGVAYPDDAGKLWIPR